MDYGKEPFDLKLTLLRMGRQLDLILVVTLIGTLLFGGGYYMKKVIFRPESTYSATSRYKITYDGETEMDVAQIYINETSWNTYMHTDLFLEAIQEHLTGVELTKEELSETLSARLESDLRVPSIIVTTNQPELSMQISQAVESAMTENFADFTREIKQIQIVESGDSAEEIIPDARPLRAFILSAVLSFFFVMVFVLLKELTDDNVWLPATLRRRYGLRTAGTIEGEECLTNLEHFFAGRKRIGVCSSEAMDTQAVVQRLREKADGISGKAQKFWKEAEWIAMPTPYLSPESAERLREMDGVLLAVPAGSHSGKPVEYVLHFLEEQEVEVTGALLWAADEGLIRTYYCLPGSRGNRDE